MKLTTIFSSAIAAVGLAACGSTAVAPPTARPTLSLAAAPTVASTPTATPSPSESPLPSPSACVPNPDVPNGSCETPPVVVVTSCAAYPGTTQFGGSIAWSGADSADSFTIFDPGNHGVGEVLYTNGNTPRVARMGRWRTPTGPYQFVDNTDEIFDGSFTIRTCAVPNA